MRPRTCPSCRMPSRKLSTNGRALVSVPPRIIATRGSFVAVWAIAENATAVSKDVIPQSNRSRRYITEITASMPPNESS